MLGNERNTKVAPCPRMLAYQFQRLAHDCFGCSRIPPIEQTMAISSQYCKVLWRQLKGSPITVEGFGVSSLCVQRDGKARMGLASLRIHFHRFTHPWFGVFGSV